MEEKQFRNLGLSCGVGLPVLYFGIQLIAALFQDGYSFSTMDASELGTTASSMPWVFNTSIMVIGLVTFLVAWAVFRTLWQNRDRPILTLVAALGIVCLGIGSLNAGLYPLPDQRHMTGPLAIAGLGMIAVPFAFPLAIRQKQGSRWFWIGYFGNIFILLSMAFVVSGMLQRSFAWAGMDMDTLQYVLNNTSGLIQRVTAFAIYVPIAIGCFVLRSEQGNSLRNDSS